MGIYGFLKKIPGGIIVIPLLIGAVINTAFPNLLTALGGMTAALFKTGTLAFAGLVLFATGATLSLSEFSMALKRGGVLCLTKIVLAFGLSFAFIKVFGMDGILGISSVAFVAAMCSTSPGVYIGVVEGCGDAADKATFAFLNIVSMPAIPVFIIGAAASSGFNYMEIITVFIPFILGVVLGNLDKGLPKIFGATMPIALPFLGFCFGASVNILDAVKSGVGGILLSLICLVINSLVLIFVDKAVLRRPGYAGSAMCATAGISMAVPALLGEAYAQYAQAAIAQLAFCVIITSFVTPFISKWVIKKWGSGKQIDSMNHAVQQP